MKAINPFAVLGVEVNATREEIEAAHKRLVRKHHPDRHAHRGPDAQEQAARRTVELNEAHDLLTDPERAAAHRRAIARAREAGIDVGRAADVGGPVIDTPRDEDTRQALRERKEMAARGTTGGRRQGHTSFTAQKRRRWFG
jgi:curved DNA-binding protein CbpA